MRELHGHQPGVEQWALDLPGFGDSPPGERHNVDGYVDDVVAFLELFEEPVHVVANSLGGMICVFAAAHRPDLVRSLGLISPAMPQYRVPWAAAAMAVMALPGLGERVVDRAGRVPAERQMAQLAAVLFADSSAVPEEDLDFAFRERARWAELDHSSVVLLGVLRSIIGQYTMPPRRSAWGAASRVLCPVLVTMASRDTLVGVWGRNRWRRTLPHARLVLMPSSGHVAMMEHPRAIGDVIRQFHHDVG